MNTIYQCPVCKRYLMDDGSWEHPTTFQMAMAVLYSDRVELAHKLCEDCDIGGYDGKRP